MKKIKKSRTAPKAGRPKATKKTAPGPKQECQRRSFRRHWPPSAPDAKRSPESPLYVGSFPNYARARRSVLLCPPVQPHFEKCAFTKR